jgi:hypothetical protein
MVCHLCSLRGKEWKFKINWHHVEYLSEILKIYARNTNTQHKPTKNPNVVVESMAYVFLIVQLIATILCPETSCPVWDCSLIYSDSHTNTLVST